MSDILDDVLADTPKDAPKTAPETHASAPQPQLPLEAPQGTPGANAAAGADVSQPGTEATHTGATTPPPGYVPLSALLDDREKRQKAQAEAEALKAQLAKLQAQQQPSPPSWQDDPEGWARTVEQRVAEKARDIKFEQSEMFASMAYGAELVEKAKAWSEDKARSEASAYGYSPFVTMLHHQRHPLEWVVNEYKQAQRLAEVGQDWDAWARKRAAELAAQTEPNAQAPNGHAPPQPATPQARPAFNPPKSLVDAPSAGGMRGGTPLGPEAAFAAMLPK